MTKLKTLLISSLCVFTLAVSGQVNTGDFTEIYLKSGYRVKGKVIAINKGETITLETIDGTEISYQYDEIESFGRAPKQQSNSQSNNKLQVSMDDIQFMAQLGIGFAGSTNSDFNNFESKSTFKFPALIGVRAKYSIDTMFALNADLNYERKGYSIFDNSEKIYSQSLNYITLPLYAGINYPYEGMTFYGHLGPYIGLLIGEKTKYEENSSSYTNNWYYYGHRTIDLGWFIAAGIKIPYNQEMSFRAGIRYSRGFSNTNYDDAMKNKMFLVTGSLLYNF
jgi:opacity protein-like surface antigen